VKRSLQPSASSAQQSERYAHVPTAPVDLLSETDAARHFGYFDRACVNPVRAFQQCARRLGIPVKYAGRVRRYDPRVLDAFMERETWTRRHRPTVTARLSLVNDRSVSGKRVAGTR
jgi:hypothetical protein